MVLSFDYAYFCVLHGVCGSQQLPASALVPAHEPPGMSSPSICARWDEVLMQFQDARERRARDVVQEIASDGSLTPCDSPTWRTQCAGQVIENTTMTLVYGKTRDRIYYSSVCNIFRPSQARRCLQLVQRLSSTDYCTASTQCITTCITILWTKTTGAHHVQLRFRLYNPGQSATALSPLPIYAKLKHCFISDPLSPPD
jgi:hypothetical protein